jgi:hypothetical protein
MKFEGRRGEWKRIIKLQIFETTRTLIVNFGTQIKLRFIKIN